LTAVKRYLGATYLVAGIQSTLKCFSSFALFTLVLCAAALSSISAGFGWFGLSQGTIISMNSENYTPLVESATIITL
jgi:hypothetical protein